MRVPELIVGIILVVVLFGAAVFFVRRQVRMLRLLQLDSDLSPEDRAHYQRQARRRIVCSALMALFGCFLIGWFFIEGLIPEPDPAEVAAGRRPGVVEFIAWYWIFGLLLLFAMLALAVFDVVATARFGMKLHRRLARQHQAELEQEALRLRQGRHDGNGQMGH